MHFKEFVHSGYVSSRESIECKFPWSDATRVIKPGSVGCVDGFTKVLCMVGIIACCCELVSQLENHASLGVVTLKYLKHFLLGMSLG